jgi:hypothetical protein
MSGYSEEFAEVYTAMYQASTRLGILPSKFVDGGPPSHFGTWGAIRFPGDEDNPVCQATKDFNDNPPPNTFTIAL